MKKIAYTVSRFPSLYETFILREIAAIKDRGFDIKIFSLKKPGTDHIHDEAAGLMDKVCYSPYLLSLPLIFSQFYYLFTRPFTYVRLMLYIILHCSSDLPTLVKSLAVFPKSVHYARTIKKNGITHVHAHWATVPTLSALVISKLTDLPFSVTAHAVDIFQNTTMLEEKLSQAKFIVTCAGYNKKYLLESFSKIDPERVFINYHGIDLGKFKRGERRRPDSTTISILAVGRLEESKGYKYLLEACAALRRKDIPLSLTIVGNGPLRQYVAGLVATLGLDDCVNLAGVLPQEEVIRCYERSDLFVLPAVSQFHWGIPNVVIEAMAMEMPVITTPLPAMSELIEDGKNGVIVPEKDSKALAEAIEKVIASGEMRSKLGSNARRTIERVFDNRKTVSELVEIYEKLIA